MTYELEILKQLSVDPSLDSIYVLTTQEGPAILFWKLESAIK